MILGIVAGPVLGLVSPAHFGKLGPILTSLALIIILFEGGTSMSIPSVVRSLPATGGITLLSFAATVAISTAVMVWGFGTSVFAGVAVGTILGGTSSAVVMPMVRGLKLKEPAGTVLVLESSLTDVLCFVMTLGVLQAMSSEQAAVGKIVGEVLAAFIFAAVIGVVGGHAWLLVLDKVRKFPHTTFTTVAAIFILYGVSQLLGYSGAITALSFGITLTNFRFFHFNRLPLLRDVEWSRLNETELKFYTEIVFLMKLYFFVYLGISMRFDRLETFWFPAILIGAVYVVRLVITRLVVSKEVPWFERSVIGVMAPKGLVAAVLAGLPAEYGVPEAGLIQEVVYRAVLLSIVLTAVLVPLIERTSIFKRFFAPPSVVENR
jgi:NhaP-type Na+/H+ or K+/H+ antiporter